MNSRAPILICFAAVSTFVSSCGYHAGGKAETIPKAIQTIYIPPFATTSTRYRLIDVLPQQVGREFNAQARFRTVQSPADADAILNGSINATQTSPSVIDPVSGKATSVQVFVVVSISLVERATGRVLYAQNNMSFRQNYSIAVDPHQFFDESGPAFDRLSRDLSHDVVSSILENF